MKRVRFAGALLALSALLVPAGVGSPASAKEQVAGNDGWMRTGSFPLNSSQYGKVPDLGANVHRGQDITAFCALDYDEGPRSTQGKNFVYARTAVVGPGQAYEPPADTHKPIPGSSLADASVPADRQAAFAFVVNTFGRSAAARDTVDEARSVHYALLSLTKGGPSQHKHFSQHLAPAGVKARAAEMLKIAEAYKGPYTVPVAVQADKSGTAGTVSGIGVRSAAGGFLANKPYTVTLTGPATFADGKREASGSTGLEAVSMPVVLTGAGQVSVSVTVGDIPASEFAVLEDSLAQDMWWSRKPVSVSGAAQLRVAPFMPSAVTRATEQVKVGEQIADEVELKATSGAWPVDKAGKSVPVKARVNVYGPLEDKPVEQKQVPAGAPVAGSTVLTFAGPGKQMTKGVTVTEPGYYTWVVSVKKADQTSEVAARMSGDYVSPFGEAVETSHVVERELPTVRTKAVPTVKVGEDFWDTAIVTDEDEYFKHSQADHYVGFELYGPSESAQCEAPIYTAEPVQIEGAGEYESAKTKVDRTGRYYWVETLYEVPKGEKPSKDSKVLHRGKCGEPDETTEITARDESKGKADLPVTGSAGTGWLAGIAAASVVGAGGVMAWRKRMAR